MYWKVLKDGKVIDVLDRLVYVKYNKKHNRMMLTTDVREAEAFKSSDRQHSWHSTDFKPVPVDGYDTVVLNEIDEEEYKRLKRLHLMDYEQIVDEVILSLIEGGIL